MRIYSDSGEETLRARYLSKDWVGEGFLTTEQYEHVERETIYDLRRTNVFLRFVLFFFTLVIVGAAAGLFFEIFFSNPSQQTIGIFLMIFGALSYTAAELAVGRARLYRYGIEEALLACSVVLLCAGMQFAFFSDSFLSTTTNKAGIAVPAVGILLSLWIWHRFGLPYAFLAAMIFAVWLPGYWTSFPVAQHLVIAAIYVNGLIAVALLRIRHRFSYLNDRFSLAEALLWLGIYLAINLQLSSLDLMGNWGIRLHATSDSPRPFYWTTWVLTWLLPPIILARGIREKDRFVIIVGGLIAILTLITNKPYLGWERHTWDPMILGALLIGVALFIRRWLANAPDRIRHGFTAQRLSGKDNSWVSAGAATLGLLSPNIVPHSQTESPDVQFGGGKSGGGGATSDF